MVKSNCTQPVRVEAGGTGVVAYVGLHALGSFADRIGLPASLVGVIAPRGERLPGHDRAKVLCQVMLMLAAGGEACSDIEVLRSQSALFGPVASTTTTWRTFHELDAAALERFAAAIADCRREQHPALNSPSGEVVIDIDASLHELHTEKHGAGATYKGRYGFHLIYAFDDRTGECLARLLRPGNAAANTIADHITVLDAAVAALLEHIAARHAKDDPAELAQHQIRVRTDSAVCNAFVWDCVARNIAFSVVARSNDTIHMAIRRTRSDAELWAPAIDQHGNECGDAQVAELTDHVD